MKKLLPLLLAVFLTACFTSCDMRSSQQKAEKLVEDYLGNKFINGTQFSIVKNTTAEAIYAPAAAAVKPADRTVIGWYMYTIYLNKTALGGLASHTILVTIDADLLKITKVTNIGGH